MAKQKGTKAIQEKAQRPPPPKGQQIQMRVHSYTRIVCVVFSFFSSFFLDLRYIRTFWMRFRTFVFPSDFRNKYNFFVTVGSSARRWKKGHYGHAKGHT